MKAYETTESDWKTFRKRVPEWRERYLETKNKEISKGISRKDKTPTESFWDAKEAIDREARILRDCFDGHSRSKLTFFLLLMHGNGIISDADLEEFSAGLQKHMKRALGDE